MTAFNINYDTTPNWMKESRNNSFSRAKKTVPKVNILKYIVPAAIGLAFSTVFLTLDEQNIKNKIATKQLQAKVSQTINFLNHTIIQKDEVIDKRISGLEDTLGSVKDINQIQEDAILQNEASYTRSQEHVLSQFKSLQQQYGQNSQQYTNKLEQLTQRLQELATNQDTTREIQINHGFQLNTLDERSRTYSLPIKNTKANITLEGDIALQNKGMKLVDKQGRITLGIAKNTNYQSLSFASNLVGGYNLIANNDDNCNAFISNGKEVSNYNINHIDCKAQLYNPKTNKFLPDNFITIKSQDYNINHTNQ